MVLLGWITVCVVGHNLYVRRNGSNASLVKESSHVALYNAPLSSMHIEYISWLNSETNSFEVLEDLASSQPNAIKGDCNAIIKPTK